MLIGSDLKTQQPDHGRHVRKHIIISLAHPLHPTAKVIQRFFSFIKSKRNENTGISPIRKNSTIKIADKDKTRILNHQSSSAFSIDDQKTPEIKSPHASDMDDI